MIMKEFMELLGENDTTLLENNHIPEKDIWRLVNTKHPEIVYFVVHNNYTHKTTKMYEKISEFLHNFGIEYRLKISRGLLKDKKLSAKAISNLVEMEFNSTTFNRIMDHPNVNKEHIIKMTESTLNWDFINMSLLKKLIKHPLAPGWLKARVYTLHGDSISNYPY
jgi:hypothetical protein